VKIDFMPGLSERWEPDPTGRFGEFGGRYIPETLMAAVTELERVYAAA